jgi:hypothetical protein
MSKNPLGRRNFDMKTHTTVWRVPLWAYAPLGAAIVAEAISNALRAYGLGQHLDHFTVSIYGYPISIAGSVLVLAAVAVSLSQARAAWVALTPNPLRQRIVAGLAACLLLTVSATAMVSHILEAQRAKVADEGGARGAYDRAEAAYKRAAAELEALGTPRPVSVIQAEVKAFPINPALWRRSAQCEDATKPDTQAYCDPILALYKERGAAARKTELEPEVSRLRTELASLNRPEAVSAEEAEIGGWWAWIMGAAVVFVATFGSVIFARATREESSQVAPPSATVSGLSRPLPSIQTDFYPGDINEARKLGIGGEPGASNWGNPRNGGAIGGIGGARTPPIRGNGGSARVFSRAEALLDLTRRLASGETVDAQNDLAAEWGIDKSTVSKWVKRWQADGLIPSAQRVGRCHRLVAAI